jgi:DNA-binding IclR family transcriptional regulator
VAFLPEERLATLLARLPFTPRTRRTITSPPALRAELERVRKRGYAIDNEEAEEGLRCIGAPVRDYSGEVVASISIAGPVFRVQKGRVAELARAVVKAAGDLSADLGYVKPLPRRKREMS